MTDRQRLVPADALLFFIRGQIKLNNCTLRRILDAFLRQLASRKLDVHCVRNGSSATKNRASAGDGHVLTLQPHERSDARQKAHLSMCPTVVIASCY